MTYLVSCHFFIYLFFCYLHYILKFINFILSLYFPTNNTVAQNGIFQYNFNG